MVDSKDSLGLLGTVSRATSDPNAYPIKDLDGQTMGVFNARQLRPHRKARLAEVDGESTGSDARSDESRDSEETISQDDDASYAETSDDDDEIDVVELNAMTAQQDAGVGECRDKANPIDQVRGALKNRAVTWRATSAHVPSQRPTLSCRENVAKCSTTVT